MVATFAAAFPLVWTSVFAQRSSVESESPLNASNPILISSAPKSLVFLLEIDS